MSIRRAFTRRAKRNDLFAPSRAGSIRNQISGPIQLLSTTNMLSYDAPDIKVLRAIRSWSSIPRNTGEDSDTSAGTEPSLTDGSSTDSSSDRSASPTIEYNHLTAYFPAQPNLKRSASARTVSPGFDAPIIPKRATSHSKREHERLARKRSLALSRPGSSRSIGGSDLMGSGRTSPLVAAHPFLQELEQLNEVAEDFWTVARGAEMDEDAVIMQTKGLLKFQADEYSMEIGALWASTLEEGLPNKTAGGWI